MPLIPHLKIIFIHIPRTSGTTFEREVLNLNGQQLILNIYGVLVNLKTLKKFIQCTI